MLYDTLSVGENGHLFFSGHDTVALAHTYGTPLYVMDETRIRERCRTYRRAMTRAFGGDSMPMFASKALSIRRIYEIMREEGMGVDVVSSGELYTAVQAGFDPALICFHGNCKTNTDVAFGMENGVGYFVSDTADELAVIDREAAKRGIRQNVLLRLTPGIDPHTHAKITTGNVDSKFGADIASGQAANLCRYALSLPHVQLCGFHCHIGSQIFECEPFCEAADVMVRFMASMKRENGYETKILNLGGGMGVRYAESDPEIDYEANLMRIGERLRASCAENGIPMPTVLTEPGRSIVADAGLTLYTVGGRKEIPGVRNYVSVDGGMADNPRYTLYRAAYTVLSANRADETPDYLCTVAGRCCESGDLLQEDVSLPRPERGDILAVLTTGAYNYAMASNYNALCKPPLVMLTPKGEYVAVRRETFADMIACQQ